MTSKLVTEVISYLGRYGRDLITGAEGVVTSVSFDIGGHIQIELNRGLDSDGKPFEAYWCDVVRFQLGSCGSVPVPNPFLA